jgi:hypothetical protein
MIQSKPTQSTKLINSSKPNHPTRINPQATTKPLYIKTNNLTINHHQSSNQSPRINTTSQ